MNTFVKVVLVVVKGGSGSGKEVEESVLAIAGIDPTKLMMVSFFV